MQFTKKLLARMREVQSCVCVGIDPDKDKLSGITKPFMLLDWCKLLLENVAPYAAALKPNCAFFEGFFPGSPSAGMRVLEDLAAIISLEHPNIPVILDAKRGDIGNTARNYATLFDMGVDAITCAPYLGSDSVFEFMKRGFTFVLCRTSNKSAGELQNHPPENPLYVHVARLIAEWRNTYPECGLVCGATYPEELAEIIGITGRAPLLIPGIGRQGGDLEKTVRAAVDANTRAFQRPFVINSSSGIIFAGSPEDAAHELRDNINTLLPDGFYEQAAA